jgi:hypothetical protein
MGEPAHNIVTESTPAVRPAGPLALLPKKAFKINAAASPNSVTDSIDPAG